MCGSSAVIGLLRSIRSVKVNVPGAGAADRMPGERVPGLLPPRPAVARVRAGEVRGVVRKLRRRRVREVAPDVTREGDAHGKPGERDDERRDARDPLDAGAPLSRDRVASDEACSEGDEERARDEHEREDPAVVRTNRARLPVLRDARQRERDPEHGRARAAAERDCSEALDAVAVEQHPRSGCEARRARRRSAST